LNATQILGTRLMDPRSLEDDASATVSVVQRYLPLFKPNFKLDLKHGWWSFELPRSPAAEYQFSLNGELGGERQMSARRAQDAEKSVSTNHFWYGAMEMADFRDDSSRLEMLFHEQVVSLLRYPTRIVENKGVIWLSYRAEYQSDAGWRRLRGGVSYLGLGFGIPFFGKERVYTSPAVVSWAQA
jgi:hypothetical protein